MTPLKYMVTRTSRVEARLCILLIFLTSQFSQSHTFFFKTQTNCSVLCKCQENAIENVMKHYTMNHLILMGGRYRPELSNFDSGTEYMIFLGTFAPILHRIVEIKCDLSDGQSHSIMSLLNGIEDVMDTSLEVKCRKGEDLIWDTPSWQTSFNIFASQHCTILTPEKKKSILIPMNMWIMDVEKGGADALELFDLKYTMNTVTLSVTGSKAEKLPSHWFNKYMISAAVVNLQDNGIEQYDCPLHFTRKLNALNLDGNKLTQIPECLLDPDYTRITFLSLSKNLIADLAIIYELPGNFKVPDIDIINLSFNHFRSIEAMRNMGNLTILDLSHNSIKDITVNAFDNLKNLQVLYLHHNKIHNIEAHGFSQNHLLNNIDLSYNFLTVVKPEQFALGPHTLTLDVRHNKLIYPPFRDCFVNQSEHFNIEVYSAGNPFFCDCHMLEFENCQRWIQNNKSSYIRRSVFMDLNDMKCTAPPGSIDMNLGNMNFVSKCIVVDDCPSPCSCILMDVAKLIVNCSATSLLEMPDTIPVIPQTNAVLYLDHNPMQMLSHRPYLRGLTELYAHNCLLTSVTPAAMAALQDIQVITLHNNHLQKLPSSTRNIILNHATNITLHNNRWKCSCDSLWLPEWITKHKSSLWMPGNIVCNYMKKPVEELSDMDLNCSASAYLDTFLAVVLGLSSIVTTLMIVICYRSEINALLYSRLGLRLGYSFSYGDFFNPYDAFVSYSQDNYRWVVDTLVPNLEIGQKKYKLCLHYRDFPTGESVIDNLPWAIRLSRCAVLVLSKDFLKKEWCIMEVRTAFQRLLLVANRLIIIATDDINIDDLSPDLRAYMNTHEYLRVNEPCFWEKLEMFLPPKPFSAEQEQLDHMSRQAAGDSKSQNPTEKHEENILSNMSELSCKPTEMTDHDF